MYDSKNSITLLMPVPEFRQMAYVSIDEMATEAWISPTAFSLQFPSAVAALCGQQTAGIPVVTRERITDNKYVVTPPSSYVRYRESLPMVPDPVLQDYLKDNITYTKIKHWPRHGQLMQQENTPRVAHSKKIKVAKHGTSTNLHCN